MNLSYPAQRKGIKLLWRVSGNAFRNAVPACNITQIGIKLTVAVDTLQLFTAIYSYRQAAPA